MPAVVIAKTDDEIADLIDRVRASADPDVGLVVPASSRALLTPLNVRLLAQFSNQSGRRTSIVSEDPRLQQLARASGLPVYGSVPAFERGIELAGPRAGGSAARPGRGRRRRRYGRRSRAGTAACSATAPPPLSPPAHAPATSRLEPRRVITQLPPAGRPPRGLDRRRFLYIAAAAIAIIGLVLFMALAPSAKVDDHHRGHPAFGELDDSGDHQSRYRRNSRPRAHRRGEQYRVVPVHGNSDRNQDASGGGGEGDTDVFD